MGFVRKEPQRRDTARARTREQTQDRGWEDPAVHRSRRTFMNWALKKILADPNHPLRFLVSIKEDVNGNVLCDRHSRPILFWNQITKITRSGNRIRGRFPIPENIVSSLHSDDRKKFMVQAGHMLARSAGRVERYMLEDADSNILGGETIESKGATSAKRAVLIGSIPVDVDTAKRWASTGVLGSLGRDIRKHLRNVIEPPS